MMRRYGEPAFALFVPAAFAVTGGPFIHYSEILLALPAALLLFARGPKAVRVPAAACLLLVALLWQSVAIQPARILEIAAGAYLIAWLSIETRGAVRLRIAFGAVLIAGAVMIAAAHFGPQTVYHAAGAHLDPVLAQASWARHIGAETYSGGLIWWIAKWPTWSGLALLALSCAYAVAQKDVVPAVIIEQAPAGA